MNIVSKLSGFEVGGISLPLLIVAVPNSDKNLINHEKIHIAQQLETLVIGFYIIYLTEYLYYRISQKLDHYNAYMSISFEKEAYEFEEYHEYLNFRKSYKWFNYLSK